MPYEKLEDLPDRVKDNLPHHAQEIFQEAFNSAEEQYDQEDTAFKVAWSAVENEYTKNDDGDWVKREGED
ncbi:ChaB family protein [Pseudalkalibacillus caeni]|uniref:Cation transporter n=1 Tax=Exobacillus caeni TaxID=2574798 RepID=A0A5R9F242_9BACL|nr:ChaB family protein [Pseudalkalibacillus caeni]TLS37712.1 cation transporter [Pseudalkalibacillus caeni]